MISVTHALEVLEFDQVRSRLAQHCQSPLAVTWALSILPSYDLAEIERLLAETSEASDYLDLEGSPSLAAIGELIIPIEIAGKGGTLEGSILYAVGRALEAMRQVRSGLKNRSQFTLLWEYGIKLPELKGLEDRLLSSFDGDGEVQDTASAALATLRKQKRQAAAKLTQKINSFTSGSMREYLSDPIVTQRAGRYVVPVRSEHRGKIKGVVHDTSSSGQTLFVEPIEVLEIGNSLRAAEAAELAEVARILAELSAWVGTEAASIKIGLTSAAKIDLIFAKARYGHALRGVVATKGPVASISIQGARHPLLDYDSTVPLDLQLGLSGIIGLLITGPNTGGKTVALKTTGLVVAMNQCGMMVPALGAKLGVFSQIWADIGDEQSLQQSLSTFSAHIKNIGEALSGLRVGGLVLLDEVGAGTDPAEGAALAKAILTEITERDARFLASTHFGELKVFAADEPGLLNCSMEFDVKTLRPTYKLLIGTPGASHGLKIAERYGMPRSVLKRATEHRGTGELELSRMLENLEASQRQAQKAQSEADRLAHRLREVEAKAEQKLKEAEEKSRNAKARAVEAVEDELREIRNQAAELFEDLKKKGVTGIDSAREKVKRLSQEGSELAKSLKPEERSAPAQLIVKGSRVKMIGATQVGVVLDEPRGGTARVQLGAMKMTLPLTQLELAESAATVRREARKSMQFEKLSTIQTEISLRGMRFEDAEQVLEKFLDEAILAGVSKIRIVHGKGEGILMQMARRMLRSNKAVKSYFEADPNEGGSGVTIAELR